jgi:hypothetical protein
MSRPTIARIMQAAVLVLSPLLYTACPWDHQSLVPQPDGTATVGSGSAAITIPKAVVDNTTAVLDVALNNCKDSSLGQNLPSTTCAGRALGDGLHCPTSTNKKLDPVTCTYQYNANIEIDVPGVGKGTATADHTITTISTANDTTDHSHQTNATTAQTCVTPYVFWRVVVNQTTSIQVSITVAGAPAKVEVNGGSKGSRTGLALCGTKTHPPPLTCGPG